MSILIVVVDFLTNQLALQVFPPILERVNYCITTRKCPIIISCCKIGLDSISMLSRKGNCIRSIHRSFSISPRLEIHSCPNCFLIETSGKWCCVYHNIFGILFVSYCCFIKFVIKSKSITNFIIFIAYPARKDRLIKVVRGIPNICIPTKLIVLIRDVTNYSVCLINVPWVKFDNVVWVDIP